MGARPKDGDSGWGARRREHHRETVGDEKKGREPVVTVLLVSPKHLETRRGARKGQRGSAYFKEENKWVAPIHRKVAGPNDREESRNARDDLEMGGLAGTAKKDTRELAMKRRALACRAEGTWKRIMNKGQENPFHLEPPSGHQHESSYSLTSYLGLEIRKGPLKTIVADRKGRKNGLSSRSEGDK